MLEARVRNLRCEGVCVGVENFIEAEEDRTNNPWLWGCVLNAQRKSATSSVDMEGGENLGFRFAAFTINSRRTLRAQFEKSGICAMQV